MAMHKFQGKPLPMERLHYHYIPIAGASWDILKDMAKKVNVMGYDALAGLKAGIAKKDNTQWIKMLNSLANFENQRGETLGPVDNLSPKYMVAIDSLTGLNHMARALHVGMKPSLHQGEWGVSMQLLESFVNFFTANTKCFTTLTGHVDKEMDEILGKPQFMPGFLGRKLAPKVPRMFSDVILQTRDEDKFGWSTTRLNYSSLKARNLGLSDRLNPDFGQVIKHWAKRHNIKAEDLK